MENKDLKIILINDTFSPKIDGVVKVVKNYAELLSKQGAKVLILAPKYPNYDLNADQNLPYKILRLPIHKLKLGGYERIKTKLSASTWKEIEKFKPNLIHAHSPFYAAQIAKQISNKFNIRSVFTFHTLFYDSFLRITKSKIISRLLTKSIIKKINSFDYVWATSKIAEKAIKNYGYSGQIKIMSNGIDFNRMQNLEEAKNFVIQKWKIDANKKKLLYVSRLVWEKNIKNVLLTFKELLKNDPLYSLTIVGDGPNYKKIVKFANRIGIDKKVLFTGIIENKNELAGFYLSHDLFFYPSLYETFGLVVKEAAQLNLPILVVEKTACADNVIDKINGFLCINNVNDMVKKIQEIFANKSVLVEVSKNVNSLAKDWDEIILKVIDNYKKIIETNN